MCLYFFNQSLGRQIQDALTTSHYVSANIFKNVLQRKIKCLKLDQRSTKECDIQKFHPKHILVFLCEGITMTNVFKLYLHIIFHFNGSKHLGENDSFTFSHWYCFREKLSSFKSRIEMYGGSSCK